MGDEAEVQMLRNSDVQRQAIPSGGSLRAKDNVKPPAGCVERLLNFRDRNILIGACRQYCDKDGKGDYKSASRLDRATRLLNLQETIEYFTMLDDSLEDALFNWQRERNNYLSWRQYQAGGITLDELKKKAPSVDPSSPPKKPNKNQPEATPDEMRGKEREFYIPSALDAWLQSVLRTATFPAFSAEYVTELCLKFGVKEEE